MTKNISRDRHVAVLPFPFSSHAGRLLTLVRRLAAAAPNVTFSFYSTPKSIESLFSPAERVPGNVRPYAVPDGVPEGHVFSGEPVEHINLYLTAVGEGESLRGVLKAAEAETGRRIGCVMSDAFMWFAGDLAEEMGVPWVPLMAGGANSITAHFYTDLIRETVGMHGKRFLFLVLASICPWLKYMCTTIILFNRKMFSICELWRFGFGSD